jgi:hypothetical protein
MQFNEPEYTPHSSRVRRISLFSRLVIKAGLAKDEAGAQKVLLLILVVVVIATIVTWWFNNPPATNPPLPPTP